MNNLFFSFIKSKKVAPQKYPEYVKFQRSLNEKLFKGFENLASEFVFSS